MPKFAEQDKLYTYILTTILTQKTDMSMDKNIVRKFMENFGPGGVADACILWLIRKNRLYFQVFSQDVVRWLLLLFGKKSIENPQVTQWLNERYNEDRYNYIINNLWSFYCQFSDTEYTQFELEKINSVKRLLRTTRLERQYLSHSQKLELRHTLKVYYDDVFPLIVCARKVVFEKQFDVNEVSKAIESDFSTLDTIQAKEDCIKRLFNKYRNSLFNMMQTHFEPIEDGLIKKTSANRIVSDSRHSMFVGSYNTYDSYVRSVRREQQSWNELLCMVTTTQQPSSNPSTSDVVLSQLGAFANPLSQFGEALNVLLSNYGIVFSELKEKLGINIDIKVSINVPNTNLPSSSQQEQIVLPVITADGINLPDALNTPKAQKYFMIAYEKKWLYPTNDGKLKWVGFNPRPSNTQLAYLCGKIYGYKYSVSGNAGENIPYSVLENLFDVKKMAFTLQQSYKKTDQAWKKVIDNLFTDFE